MALWDRMAAAIAAAPVLEPGPWLPDRRDAQLQRRAYDYGSYPPLSSQLEAIRNRGQLRPWRPASLSEALGYPAIFAACTLIANTVATLTLQAYLRGALVPDAERPRVMVRPNPLTTLREFLRQTAWDMATTGEAWWWTAARDPITGAALSVVPVAPREIQLSENPADPRFPVLEWRGRVRDNRDFKQVVMQRRSGELRGIGPLQACGAAVSVAVEAQEWAASFFAGGGYPSIIIRSAVPLGENPEDPEGLTEAERMAAEWMNKPHNLPRVVDPRTEEIQEVEANPQGSQMLSAREYQVGDAARMFNIPGSLLEHSTPGSSLTYQNVGQEFDKFARVCLIPNYLEPVEQEFSDYLPRDEVSRFNVRALLRADIKTRYDVHAIAIDKGIYGPETAQAEEGYAPGDVEFAPAPPALPSAAVPIVEKRSLPALQEVRCAGTVAVRGRLQACGRLLGRLAAPYEVQCPRCHTLATA